MRHALVVGVFAAVGLLAAAPAEACGGFFCAQVPIDQAGERIVFGVRENSVEAHVQIQYQGAAEQFAWVVPVPVRPTLSVGVSQLFTYLDSMTQPRFQLQWQRDSCFNPTDLLPFPRAPNDSVSDPPEGGGVNVVSREDVGPYDAVILSAGDAVALYRWLTDNGYFIPEQSAGMLQPYVNDRYYFVALKLRQDKGVGDLRPIVLRMATNRPCIPIRLTAIAARPDMPIIAYVLAGQRAVPTNYRHVLINPTRVNWLNGGGNYPQVASEAVDEAGGQAFLTEFAGESRSIAVGFSGFVRPYNTSLLVRYTHPVDFVMEMLMQGGPNDGAVRSLLRQYIPMPASLVRRGVQEAEFYDRIASWRNEIDTDPGRAPFDAQGLARALEEQVGVPLMQADELLQSYPYLTRLYTTMSAEEMTVDPDFDFNPDAPPVSNLFTAKASFATCEADFMQRKVRIELPDGRFFIVNSSNPIPEGPGALRVEQYDISGPPALVQDNGARVNEVIRRFGGGLVGEGCACGVTEPGSLALLALLAAGVWSRRRERSLVPQPAE